MRENGCSYQNFATKDWTDIALEHLKRASRKGIYRVAARLVLSPSRPKSVEIFGECTTQNTHTTTTTTHKETPFREKEQQMTDEDDELQQQMDEIEALRSIFMEDFHEVCELGNRIQSVPPEVKCYEIVLSPLASHEDASEIINTDDSKNNSSDLVDARLGVVFAHSTKYPNEMPFLKCRSVAKIHDEECKKLTKQLLDLAKTENMLGQPMMYDLVEFAKEWLRSRTCVREKEEETEEMVEKRLELEAEERLKAMRETGTAVTRENFERWAKAFDAERALGKWTTETNNNNDKIDDATTASAAAAAAAAATTTHAQQGAVSMSGRRFFEERYEALRKSGSLENEEGQEEDDEDEEKDSEDMSEISSEEDGFDDEIIGVKEEDEEE